MKNIKYLFVFILALTLLWACMGSDETTPLGNMIVMNGGNGGTGNGGAGGWTAIGSGYIMEWGDYPLYGDVVARNTGSLDTRFTLPDITPNYNFNKLTITGNVTAKLNLGGVCAAGDVYLSSDTPLIRYCLTADTPIDADGLEIQAGATLTLPANNYGPANSYIQTNYDMTINGTIKTDTAGNTLYVAANNMLIGPGGRITTRSTTPGTNGGYMYLIAFQKMIIQGTIDGSGSAANATFTDGTNCGGMVIESFYGIYNNGTIFCQGGSSAYGAGGVGRYVHISAYYGDVYYSGVIDARGGNGATYGGRGAKSVKFYAGGYNSSGYMDNGTIMAGGSINVDGGQGGSGSGGDGGYFKLESYGGKVWSNATITAKGGSSAADVGGNGGEFYLFGWYGDDYESMGIKLSGYVDLTGGNGATGGGYGGLLYFENQVSYADGESYYLLQSPAVEILGVSSLTANGGTGATGGAGGYYGIYTMPYLCYDCEALIFTGAILNQLPVYAKGGTGTSTGGMGGWIDFNMTYILGSVIPVFGTIPVFPTFPTITNTAAIDASGGTGPTGGVSGLAGMFGLGSVVNSGVINAKAGNGTTTGGDHFGWEYLGFDPTSIFGGGKGLVAPGKKKSLAPIKPSGPATSYTGFVALALFNIDNSGAIDFSGGNGSNDGYNGADILMYAMGGVTNSATVTTKGGTGATGGNGGSIDLYSYSWDTVYTLTQLIVSGGATGGYDGCIWIDGDPVGSGCF
jgi:hypothetical protein